MPLPRGPGAVYRDSVRGGTGRAAAPVPTGTGAASAGPMHGRDGPGQAPGAWYARSPSVAETWSAGSDSSRRMTP